MSGAAGAGAAAAAAAAVANAIKASGVIVRLEPADFQTLLNRAGEVVVVHAEEGRFSRHHAYLMSYKGLAFYTRSPSQLPLPSGTELIGAKKIWVPG